MNQKLKYVGLLAILPVLTIAMLGSFAGDAEAREKHACGNHELCMGPAAAAEAKVAPKGPSVVLVKAESSPDDESRAKLVSFKVFAGDHAIRDVQILVKSDAASLQTIANSEGKVATSIILANSYSTDTVRIKAFNLGSITVDILDFQQVDMKIHSKELQRLATGVDSMSDDTQSIKVSYDKIHSKELQRLAAS